MNNLAILRLDDGGDDYREQYLSAKGSSKNLSNYKQILYLLMLLPSPLSLSFSITSFPISYPTYPHALGVLGLMGLVRVYL